MTSSTLPVARPRVSARRSAEGGLFLVVFVFGALLAFFGGNIDRPLFKIMPDGTRERLKTVLREGEEVPATVRVNKFLNPETLIQLAKETSFVAIMAVGMTCVIIA